MVTLAVNHYVYLTREERYSLANGNPLETVGVSVPIWHVNENSSEPGQEVFCRYILTNSEDVPVSLSPDGYRINIPNAKQQPKRLPPHEWAEMSMAQQEEWYKRNSIEPSALDLLDEKDGGVESLYFKCFVKIKENKQRMNAVHMVEIKSIETLLNSLT